MVGFRLVHSLTPRLVDSIGDAGNDVPEEIKIEASHIIASLSYGQPVVLVDAPSFIGICRL